MINLRKIAEVAIKQGLAPVPVLVYRNGEKLDKRPLVAWKPFQQRMPTSEEVDAWPWDRANGLGIIPGDRVAVLDIDDADVAEQVLERLVELGLHTRVHGTRRGLHVYLRANGGRCQDIYLNGRKVGEIIAGKGHLITFASPYHIPLTDHRAFGAKGRAVESVGAFVGKLLPMARLRRPSDSSTAVIRQGGRNTYLANLAIRMARQGASQEAIDAALLADNEKRCQPPLPGEEVSEIAANKAATYPPHTGWAPGNGSWPAGDADAAGPVLVRLADVGRAEVSWVWQGRLPRGRITLFDGDPGVGKSWVSLAIAATLSRGGPLPGQAPGGEAARVLILTAEDGLADTVRPRLEDMGGDLERVEVLTAVKGADGRERHVNLMDDLPAVEAALAAGGYGLVVIDPLNAYLGTTLDTHRDAALRAVLTPLAALAERYKVSLIAIRHLTKGKRDRAIYRGQGSIAYTAAARVVHLVGVNPKNHQQRVIACIKNNLVPLPPPLAFEIGAKGLVPFHWLGETDVTPAALLAPEPEAEEATVLEEAKRFLTDALSEGPVEVKVLQKETKAAGLAWRTVERAKTALGVKAVKLGFDAGWGWELL